MGSTEGRQQAGGGAVGELSFLLPLFTEVHIGETGGIDEDIKLSGR
jgi:hypothetical protein